MLLRIAATLVLIWAAVSFPWWLNLILALVFIFCFHNFYEATLAALIFDVLRSRPEMAAKPEFLYTAIVLLGVFVIELIKKRIVFYG